MWRRGSSYRSPFQSEGRSTSPTTCDGGMLTWQIPVSTGRPGRDAISRRPSPYCTESRAVVLAMRRPRTPP